MNPRRRLLLRKKAQEKKNQTKPVETVSIEEPTQAVETPKLKKVESNELRVPAKKKTTIKKTRSLKKGK